jgi:hypothetical protein
VAELRRQDLQYSSSDAEFAATIGTNLDPFHAWDEKAQGDSTHGSRGGFGEAFAIDGDARLNIHRRNYGIAVTRNGGEGGTPQGSMSPGSYDQSAGPSLRFRKDLRQTFKHSHEAALFH